MITLFSIRFLNTWEFFFLQTYKSIFWWNPGLVFVKKCRYLIPTNTTATAWWRRISRIFKISCCRPIILRKWLMWSWMLTGGHQSARTTSSRNRATAVRPQPDRRPAAASTGHQLAAKWRQRSLCACTIVHCLHILSTQNKMTSYLHRHNYYFHHQQTYKLKLLASNCGIFVHSCKRKYISQFVYELDTWCVFS